MRAMDKFLQLLEENHVGVTRQMVRHDGTRQLRWYVDDNDDRFVTVEDLPGDQSAFLVVACDDKPFVGATAYGTAAAVVLRDQGRVFRTVEYLLDHMGNNKPVCADWLSLMV